MVRPVHLLSVASALLGVSSAVLADAVDLVPPLEATPALLLGGSAMPHAPLAVGGVGGLPTLAGIAVSHGAAPDGTTGEFMDLSGVPDAVNLGEMVSIGAPDTQGDGLTFATSGSSWSGGMDLTQPAGHSESSGAPSIPLPSAAGLCGAALALVAGGRRRRPAAAMVLGRWVRNSL